MQLTNNQLVTGFPLIAALGNIEFAAKVNIKIARAINALDREHTLFQAVRTRLIEKHAQRDGDGVKKETAPGQVVLQDPAAFNEELVELLAAKVPVAIDPITIRELGDAVPRAALLAPLLDWFIVDDEKAVDGLALP